MGLVVRDRVFARWRIAGVASAIEGAMRSIGPARNGPIAVIGEARLARALARFGRSVTFVSAGGLSRKAGTEVTIREGLADRSFAVVVGCDAGESADWEALLATWSRAVVCGGGLVMVDRSSPQELSRRALCGGLSVLEQRVHGRWVVTSGLVSDL